MRGNHAGALAAMEDGERVAARLGLRGSFGHFMYVNGAADLLRLGAGTSPRRGWTRPRGCRSRAPRPRCGARWPASCMRCAATSPAHAPSSMRRSTPSSRASSSRRSPRRGRRSRWRRARRRPRPPTSTAGLAEVQDPFYTPPLYSLALRADPDADDLLARFDALLNHAPPGALAHRALGRRRARALRRSALAGRRRGFERLAEPYPAAYARWREAEARLAAGGDRAAALRALGTAFATATQLGAAPLVSEIEALARRARLRLDDAPPAPAPTDHAGLTTRELEVLELLADGLTNRAIAERLFVSQKTVGAHVAHIYDKLGVHSRVEAAGHARRLGLLKVAPTQGGSRSTPGVGDRRPLAAGRQRLACMRVLRVSGVLRGTPTTPEGPHVSSPHHGRIGRPCHARRGHRLEFRDRTDPRPDPRADRVDRAFAPRDLERSPDVLPGGRP